MLAASSVSCPLSELSSNCRPRDTQVVGPCLLRKTLKYLARSHDVYFLVMSAPTLGLDFTIVG